MTDIRTAILKTADHLEQYPDSWDFSVSAIPRTCNSPGCALGWIHYFTGAPGAFGQIDAGTIEGLGCAYDSQFYARMNALGLHGDRWMCRDDYSRRLTIEKLRDYAETYHPVPQSEWVEGFKAGVGLAEGYEEIAAPETVRG